MTFTSPGAMSPVTESQVISQFEGRVERLVSFLVAFRAPFFARISFSFVSHRHVSHNASLALHPYLSTAVILSSPIFTELVPSEHSRPLSSGMDKFVVDVAS